MKNRQHIEHISSSKVSRELLRTITEDQFVELCARIRKTMCASKSNAPWVVKGAKRKHYRKIVRRMQSVRHPHGERRIYKKIRNFRYKPSELLDALYPQRKMTWVQPGKRRSRERPREITLQNFSFIDSPIETLERLRDIARAEAQESIFKLHFLDSICLDIGPYLVLGVIRQQMLPNCTGGKISGGLSKVLSAVELDKFLAMSIEGPRAGNVYPFPLKAGARETATEGSVGITTKQRVIDQFIDTLDMWLNAAEITLSEIGRGHVGQIIGEAIDNAERHSEGEDGRGRWWIAGFMTDRPDEKGSSAFHCHLGLLCLGSSIAASIASAPGNMRSEISLYTSKHQSKRQSESTLSTVYAVQDGITRDPPGGVGLLDMLSLAAELGQSEDGINAAVAIISGDTCILASEPFISPHDNPVIGRRLWFNNENSLDRPPDNNYVFTMPFEFPGTLVSLRFQIDSDYLKKKVENNEHP